MRQFKILGAALAAALLVAACGGGSDDAVVQPPPIQYTSLVSFGDSLSDVGTYKVGTVAMLGGGTFSVNGITGAIGDSPTPSKNWTELIAAQIGVAAPCPAQTGLDGLGGFYVPVEDHPGCTSYAQGGARVTDPVGPGNKLLGGANATLGQLTVPIVTQISNHLTAVGGSFTGTELVTMLAGANDVFRLLDELGANAKAAGAAAGAQTFASTLVGLLAAGATDPTAAAGAIGAAISALPPGTDVKVLVGTAVATAAAQPGNAAVGSPDVYGPMVASAEAAAITAGNAAGAAYAKENGAAEAVLPMGEAGKQLATYIKSQIVGKGAKYVAVVNLPDLSATPAFIEASPETRGLVLNMTIWFNDVLAYELKDVAGVRVVDAFNYSRSQIADPGGSGLSNVTGTACDLTKNALGSSLVCNSSNLNDGDVSKYLFADSVHPTPYGYKLLADLVTTNLRQAGWL